MAYKFTALAAAAFVLLIVTGCAKDNIIPPTQLPDKPASTSIPCEPLTGDEQAVCMKEASESRTICRKVEKNESICTDQQEFVNRLYDARDGK